MKLAPNVLQHEKVVWVDPKCDIWGEIISDGNEVYGYAHTDGCVYLRGDDREWVN